MKLSVILLIVCIIVWSIVLFSCVVTNELAIKPLSYIKRNLLVSMSKRKFSSAINDKISNMPEENSDSNSEETSLEEDNKQMKKLEKIILKFRIKYLIFYTILVIGTFCMMFVYKNHLDYSTILVSIIAFCCLTYVLGKFMALRDDMKEKSYEIIAKKLKLDDKFMTIIKEKNKE